VDDLVDEGLTDFHADRLCNSDQARAIVRAVLVIVGRDREGDQVRLTNRDLLRLMADFGYPCESDRPIEPLKRAYVDRDGKPAKRLALLAEVKRGRPAGPEEAASPTTFRITPALGLLLAFGVDRRADRVVESTAPTAPEPLVTDPAPEPVRRDPIDGDPLTPPDTEAADPAAEPPALDTAASDVSTAESVAIDLGPRWLCTGRFCLDGSRWWMNTWGVVNCLNCCPPASPDLVIREGALDDAPRVDPGSRRQAVDESGAPEPSQSSTKTVYTSAIGSTRPG
jgi:hypothetical protein